MSVRKGAKTKMNRKTKKMMLTLMLAMPLLIAASTDSSKNSEENDNLSIISEIAGNIKAFLTSDLSDVQVPPAAEPQEVKTENENAATNAIQPNEKTEEMANDEETRSIARQVPGTAGLSGEQLFQYLHKYVSQGYKTHGYSEAKSYMYGTADNQGCDGQAGILTFYSQVCAPGTSSRGDDYKERGDANGDGVVDNYINAEHIWPQSFFGKRTPMVSDLHHLQSTYGTPNNRRSNYKFGTVAYNEVKYSTKSGSKLGKNKYEPCDAVKGNVARSVLYFVTKYYDGNIKQKMDYNSFWTQNINLFLQWNRQDPPDAREMERNNRIEKFQGNRNPFVDDYTLADRIGATVFASH